VVPPLFTTQELPQSTAHNGN